MERNLSFDTGIALDQSERLIQIAKVCPVSKMLESEIRVTAAFTETTGKM